MNLHPRSAVVMACGFGCGPWNWRRDAAVTRRRGRPRYEIAVSVILRQEHERVTAGRLSQQSGLTTGAITHILDRLEKRRYVRRVRDTEDRRRVFVMANRAKLKSLEPKYEAIGNAYMAMLEQYSDAELQLICDYLEKTSAVWKQQLSQFVGIKQE